MSSLLPGHMTQDCLTWTERWRFLISPAHWFLLIVPLFLFSIKPKFSNLRKTGDIQSAARVSSRLTVIGWQLIMRLTEQETELIGLLWGNVIGRSGRLESKWASLVSGERFLILTSQTKNETKVRVFLSLILPFILKFLLQKTFTLLSFCVILEFYLQSQRSAFTTGFQANRQNIFSLLSILMRWYFLRWDDMNLWNVSCLW